MKRAPLGLKLPAGMKDMLPEQLALLESIEQKALKVCKDWSYKKVLTSGLEYRDCVEPSANQEDQLYKFFDKDGNILALRPEFTTPIARMASARYREEPLPFRFCYSGSVYRNVADRDREIPQLGAELVGADSSLADAEVLALLIEVMKALDLRNFQISLGHNKVIEGVIQEYGLSDLKVQLEDGIARKDMVELERLIAENNLPEDAARLLLAMPSMTGKDEVLDKLQNWQHILSVRQATESLRTTYSYLKEFGLQNYVTLDLGILKEFSYYTGVVFEGYLPGIGIPVADGGRYDGLYRDLGFAQPATGFAINLGLILEQMEEFDLESADVLVYGQSPLKVIKRCRELRRSGKKVEMALSFLTAESAQELAAKRNIGTVERVV